MANVAAADDAATDDADGEVTYTAEDLANADKFAQYNYRVRLLAKMHERAPHLVSWLRVSWRPATDDDFYVPESLRSIARVIDVRYTETFCKMINCQSMKEQEPCVPNEEPSWYRVGDDSWDVQCQAACYNTALKPTYDKNGARAADVPWVNYHRGECRLVPAAASNLEKTFYRSQARYELRVNNMPTGFSRVKTDDPHSCGFTYRNNPSYCAYFDQHWNPSTQDCQQTGLEYVVDAVLGMSLVNAVRSSIRQWTDASDQLPLPTGLPSPPQPRPPDMYRAKGWRANVDKSFVLPELVDPFLPANGNGGKDDHVAGGDGGGGDDDETSAATAARQRRSVTSTTDSHQPAAVESKDPAVAARNAARRDAERRHLAAAADASSAATKTRTRRATGSESKLSEILRKIFTGLYEAVQDPKAWAVIGINYVNDRLLDQVRKVSLKCAERLTAYLAQGSLRFGGSLGARVIAGSVRSLSLRAVTSFAVRVGAKAAVALAKVLAATASVVGWVLVIGGLIDLVLGFWDPFGYSKMLPARYPRDAMAAFEQAQAQLYGVGDPSYGVDDLAEIILSDAERWELSLATIVDRAAYLNALVVNSEGSVIDKGQLVNTNDFTNETMERVGNEVSAARYRFDEASFRRDSARFNARTKVAKLVNRATIVAFAVGALALLTRFHLFALLAVIVAVIGLCLGFANTQYDLLVDPYVKARGLDDADATSVAP